MRRIILATAFVFAGLSTHLCASGFKIGGGALFGGKTTVNLGGTLSAPGVAAAADYKLNNSVGYGIQGSYHHSLSNNFAAYLGLGWASQTTEDKLKAATGAAYTFNLTDNDTVKSDILDLKVGAAINITDEIGVTVGVNYPLSVNFNGSFDNGTGKEDYKADASLGIDVGLSYAFMKNWEGNIGFNTMNTKDSSDTGSNTKAIVLSVKMTRMILGINYTF